MDAWRAESKLNLCTKYKLCVGYGYFTQQAGTDSITLFSRYSTVKS